MDNPIDIQPSKDDQFVRYLNGLSETCGDVFPEDAAEDLRNINANIIQFLKDKGL